MSGIVRANNTGQSGLVANTETIDSDDYVDASIDNAHLADNAADTAEIADDAVTADKLADAINTIIAANTAKTGITSGQASAITANTSKVTNATHSGDVTGATALTIATDAVDIAMLSASGTADSSTFLRGDNSWAAAGGTEAAQSDMEDEGTTNADRYVSPETQIFFPTSNKLMLNYNQRGDVEILKSYNVTSVSDNSTGNHTVTIATDFADDNYVIVNNGGFEPNNRGLIFFCTAQAAGSFTEKSSHPTGGVYDCGNCWYLCAGEY